MVVVVRSPTWQRGDRWAHCLPLLLRYKKTTRSQVLLIDLGASAALLFGMTASHHPPLLITGRPAAHAVLRQAHVAPVQSTDLS
jgi:hypothetical protein